MIDKIEDIDREDLIQTMIFASVIMGALCINCSELNSPLAMSVAKLGKEKSMKIFSSNVENNVKDLISKADITNYFSIQDFYDRNMENIKFKQKWTEFINDPKYKKYFTSNEYDWNDSLEKVKKYIDENNKKPSRCNKNEEIKSLGKWISHQLEDYKNIVAKADTSVLLKLESFWKTGQTKTTTVKQQLTNIHKNSRRS